MYARTVALAVGVMPFLDVPAALHGLPAELVSHSSHHADLGRFRDQDVTVVGGRQAALETAALLAEQGTRVRVPARAGRLVRNDLPPSPEHSPWHSLRSPHSGLGIGWRTWFHSERPGLYHRLPETTRSRVAAAALGPAGTWWVRERVEGAVEVLLDHEVAAARPVPDGLRLELRGRGSLVTDHVIAATGLRATRDRLTLLTDDLRTTLATAPDGSPRLGHAFESTHPGLFLSGLVTAAGYGPAMRFVHGATYTAETLVRGVRRRLRGGAPTARVPAPAPAERGRAVDVRR